MLFGWVGLGRLGSVFMRHSRIARTLVHANMSQYTRVQQIQKKCRWIGDSIDVYIRRFEFNTLARSTEQPHAWAYGRYGGGGEVGCKSKHINIECTNE